MTKHIPKKLTPEMMPKESLQDFLTRTALEFRALTLQREADSLAIADDDPSPPLPE